MKLDGPKKNPGIKISNLQKQTLVNEQEVTNKVLRQN